jgi:hypothetical protein
MEQDTEITNVAFYIASYPADEVDEQPFTEVLAVFVDEIEMYKPKDDTYFSCYARLGQHSTCSQSFLAENCRKATQEEYQELFNELENSVGYKLKVISWKK